MTDVDQSNTLAEGADSPAIGPGGVLRAAREARGLSIVEVSQALKLSARQVEALEADEFAILPGTVFLRGFMRSYAKFLRLDPAPLLAQLPSEASVVPPDVRPPDNMGNAAPPGGVRQLPVLAVLSVLLLLAAGAMALWHWFGDRLIALDFGATAPVVVAPIVPPQPATVPAGVDAGPTVPAPVAEPVMPPIDLHHLQLAFRGKSWVEVKDGNGDIVATGEYPAGANEMITGQPPFQLVIGNAAQVDLSYDDRRVDLRPHTRAEVARLSLE